MRHWVLACSALIFIAALPEASRADDPGTTVFNTYCAMCHQVNGQGIPGQFPRIAGRADKIALSAKGRQYLCTLVIYGMAGSVSVDGSQLIGVMPPLGSTLTDENLAAALNHVMQLSGDSKVRPFTAAEVKAERRATPLSATDVHAIRNQLASSGVIP
jgi:cytochrome c5